LYEAGQTGLDLSPGDPLCLEAANALARRDALLREISREISWDEKVGDYWKRRIERELEKK
jgi:hypothetical protein